jgi:hypothetical protein
VDQRDGVEFSLDRLGPAPSRTLSNLSLASAGECGSIEIVLGGTAGHRDTFD